MAQPSRLLGSTTVEALTRGQLPRGSGERHKHTRHLAPHGEEVGLVVIHGGGRHDEVRGELTDQPQSADACGRLPEPRPPPWPRPTELDDLCLPPIPGQDSSRASSRRYGVAAHDRERAAVTERGVAYHLRPAYLACGHRWSLGPAASRPCRSPQPRATLSQRAASASTPPREGFPGAARPRVLAVRLGCELRGLGRCRARPARSPGTIEPLAHAGKSHGRNVLPGRD